MRLVLASAALSVSLFAQSPLGTVTGLALDPSGAPVPSAHVVLTNEATGAKLESATNNSGNYLFPNLTPGSYTLAAEAKGFRKLQVESFPLAAFRTARQDLRFALETASAEITVAESASPVVQGETPSVSFQLSSKQIIDLPTNLRGFEQCGRLRPVGQIMPLTVPGVVQMGAGAYWMAPGAGPNGLRAEGGRHRHNVRQLRLARPGEPAFDGVGGGVHGQPGRQPGGVLGAWARSRR